SRWRMKNKILIADQQAQMRHLLGAVFTQQGYKVKTAQNGKDALETIYDNELDIIVLNHELPVINVVQLINCIEDNEIYTRIFIIGSPHDAIEQRTKRFSVVISVLRQLFKVLLLVDIVNSFIE